MSDRAIEDYYTQIPPNPIFAFYDSSVRKLFYASSSPVTTKPLLLLIHGAPGAWFGYKEFFHDADLLKNYQIIAPDRAGYHYSGKKETSISAHALYLSQFLKKHCYPSVTVLGRSYGAPIAAKLTADNPTLVKELILVSPACDPTTEKFWWFSKPTNTKFIRFFLPDFANRASDEKFSHRAELQKILTDWAKITCPVTILQGGKDWIIQQSNGYFVDSMLVNAPHRLIYLPTNGHLLTTERYDLVKSILLKQ
jgi:pimeloyl-ACP methyl ester carboxylesterase